MTENQEFKNRNIGLIIAAGFSKRAGTFKMTLPYKNLTVIESTVIKMLELCGRVVVITGYSAEKLLFLEKKYENLELIHNVNYEEGMYSSIKKGFSHINKYDFEKIIYTPGDYPAVSRELYKKLAIAEGDIIIPFNCREKKKGHPIAISATVIKNNAFSDFENLREFIKNKKVNFIYTEDKGILIDLDTPEDYQKLLSFEEKKEVEHYDK